MPSVVYPKHKVVYIAIDKCATGTLNNWLDIDLGKKKKRFNMYKASRLLKLYPDYYFFTFIRHPFDRVVSLAPDEIHKNPDKFIEWWQYKHFNILSKPRANTPPLKKIIWFLDIPEKINFIGMLEYLNEDYEKILGNLNIKRKSSKNRYVHKTKNRHLWQKYLDEKSIISEYYKEDLIFYEEICKKWNR
jgi:hypothetical protein